MCHVLLEVTCRHCEIESYIMRHFDTLTFYYINLKPPPTAMSIKNKQKNTSIIFYIYTMSAELKARILTWFDVLFFFFVFFALKIGNTQLYMHKETIDSS